MLQLIHIFSKINKKNDIPPNILCRNTNLVGEKQTFINKS